MEDLKLYDGEYKFVSIIWDNEPVGSTELVKLCSEQLGWKKSTTYTMIKRLSDRGIVRSERAVVTTLVAREEVQKYESETLVEKTFDGSLPSFLATFLSDKKLTASEAEELQKMIKEATKK